MTITVPDIIQERSEYTESRLNDFVAALRKALTAEDEQYSLGDQQFGKKLSDDSISFTNEMLELMLEFRDEKNDSLFRHMVI